jgi:hypothetical protein
VKKKDFKFKLSLAHIGGPWLNPQSQKKNSFCSLLNLSSLRSATKRII